MTSATRWLPRNALDICQASRFTGSPVISHPDETDWRVSSMIETEPVKQVCLSGRIGPRFPAAGKHRICERIPAASQRAMADRQWPQLRANRAGAESPASGGCHARSGAEKTATAIPYASIDGGVSKPISTRVGCYQFVETRNSSRRELSQGQPELCRAHGRSCAYVGRHRTRHIRPHARSKIRAGKLCQPGSWSPMGSY